MGLVRMTTLARRHKEHKPRPGIHPEATSESLEKYKDTAVEQITAYIPAEIVGLYVSGVGVLSPTGNGRWVLFGAVLAVIPAFIFPWRPVADDVLTRADRMKLTMLAVVAFVAWVWALPNTPFLDVSAHATVVGGFMVIVLSYFMPKIAQALDVAPSPAGQQ